MGKHSLSSIAKSVRTAMKKHSPEIQVSALLE